jgi:hypothetical protein
MQSRTERNIVKQVTNEGNLPRHLKLFATKLGGILSKSESAKFYEMFNISEMETKAVELKYEILPSIDTSTGRAFLVGFNTEEPEAITTLVQYAYLNIYFVECSTEECNQWIEKIKGHREDQQTDMYDRRSKILNRQQRRAAAKLAKRGNK